MGFMASGKSSIGRRIATKLDWTFVDLDDKIEAEAGMSIPEIFETLGEKKFRQMESEALRNCSDLDRAIIATGGGTPCKQKNIDWIKKNGKSVYLKLSVDRVFGRLREKREKRPLVAVLDDEELLDFIETKLGERAKFYEQADFVVKRKDQSKKEIRDLIIEWVKQEVKK